MKKSLLLFSCGVFLLHAETVDTNHVHTVPPVSVTALRLPEEVSKTPAFVSFLSADEIRVRQARNFPEALKEEPGVIIQKTAPGQGSPYIRGFTGYRTLLMVDGIRLNTSVMRDGPNQYWNTLDSYALSGIDLLQGPASTLYGSDAAGGVVQAFTPLPDYAAPGAFRTGGSLFLRAASAERSLVTRATGELAQDNWAALVGATFKHFGDLRGGHDIHRQRKTGYGELDFDAKFRVKLAGDRELILAHQQVDQDDVWRTHRTLYGISWKGTTIGSERKHVYDQDRTLTYAKLIDRVPNALYDQMTLTLYLGYQSELQSIQNAPGRDSSRDGFTVYTPGFNLEMQRGTPIGTLVWGADYSRDLVSSWRKFYDSSTGLLTHRDIQGIIADNSTYDLFGLFIEDRIALLDGRLELIPGLRATLAHVHAGAYDDLTKSTPTPGSFNDTWYDLSANLRAAWYLTDARDAMLYAGLGQAFRAPNLSDLTSLNATRTSSYSVPSTDLDPEKFVTAEIGAKWENTHASLDLAYFHTWIDDMMNSVNITPPPGARDTSGRTYTSRQNDTDGYVHGVELTGRLNLTDTLQLRAAFTWMEGTTHTTVSGLKTDDHLRTMPKTLLAALRWRHPSGRFWAEAAGYAADRENRLTAGDKTDTSRIPPSGTPGYATCALRAGWNPTDTLSLTAACENLLNADYRTHGSGSNEAGRNFILTARYAF